MNSPKNSLVTAVAYLAFATVPATAWAATAPCEKNFTVKDGLFDRKIYRTWQDLAALTQQMIFKRTYNYLVKDGWVMTLTDKEGWVISASQVEGLAGGAEKVTNLNVLIENAGNYYGGVPSGRGVPGAFRVTMIFSVPGGLQTHEEMVKKSFCDAFVEIKDGTYVINK